MHYNSCIIRKIRNCRRSFCYEKRLVLRFLWLLFDTTSRSRMRCITGRQTQTGHGQGPSWDSHPSEDLSEPPSLRDPALHGAVTGRKYHCRLFRSWQAAHHRLLWNGHFSLCAFDAIVLTGIFTCRRSWRILPVLFLLG